MRVLIIEDEEKTADYLHRGLTEQGYTVDVAREGVEGLHLALENDYAVIVLDVMLPGPNGFDILQQVRQNPERRSMAIIMLTAKGRDVEVTKGLALGANAYITKPFSTRDLLTEVHRCLQGA